MRLRSGRESDEPGKKDKDAFSKGKALETSLYRAAK